MALKLINVSKSYGKTAILRGVDFEIALGQFAIISGPSGSGKTTLLRLISLLEPVDQGSIQLDGIVYKYSALERTNTWERTEVYRSRICLVFQQLFMWPHMSVRTAIEKTTSTQFDYEQYADRLGIGHILDRYPNEVSLGERQRAALVRALATRADYFLFDEITSALDEVSKSVVVEILTEMIKDNKAIVTVTHNPEIFSGLEAKKYSIEAGGALNAVK